VNHGAVVFLGTFLLMVVGAGCGTIEKAEPPAPSANAGSVLPNYQPSEPNGWPGGPSGGPEGEAAVGHSLGGHTAALEFIHDEKTYRISLMSFGQSEDAPHPVYEGTPSDTTLAYQQTLADKFGDYYTFHFVGGFFGQNEIEVRSYTVFVNEPTETSPGLNFGADIYAVYTPDLSRGDPELSSNLQWIQVTHWTTNLPVATGSFVDNANRANPFYPSGGYTSVYGKPVVNFADTPQQGVSIGMPGGMGGEGAGNQPSAEFIAEVFLAEDTGEQDSDGAALVNIYGGMKYGWQIGVVP
jgi:hypothetical protein